MVAEHLHAKSGWPSQSQKWFLSKSLYIWAIHHKSTFLCKHSYRLVFDLVIAQSVDTSWENIVGIYMFASRPGCCENMLYLRYHNYSTKSLRDGRGAMRAWETCKCSHATLSVPQFHAQLCCQESQYLPSHVLIPRLSLLGLHIA